MYYKFYVPCQLAGSCTEVTSSRLVVFENHPIGDYLSRQLLYRLEEMRVIKNINLRCN